MLCGCAKTKQESGFNTVSRALSGHTLCLVYVGAQLYSEGAGCNSAISSPEHNRVVFGFYNL